MSVIVIKMWYIFRKWIATFFTLRPEYDIFKIPKSAKTARQDKTEK